MGFLAQTALKQSQWILPADVEREKSRRVHDPCQPLDSVNVLGTAVDWTPLYPCHPRRRRDLRGGDSGKASSKLPDIAAWKPGHWAAGRLMGPPPLARLDDKVLVSRVAALHRGIAKAESELSVFTERDLLLADVREAHAFIRASLAELKRELAMHLQEQTRRKEEHNSRRK